MKITIEGREFELSANGRFLQKFCKVFEENLTLVLYNAVQKRDPYAIAKLMFCAIDEENTFEEWLDSFKSPLFILPVQDKVIEYLFAETKPTVDSKDSEDSKKKAVAN